MGMREAKEDWLELGRDLATRGLAAPRLIVADGAPGLISAVEELWPRADRQHCAVHRLRNLLAKLPGSERERVRLAYWHALNEATSVKDGTLRLKVLIGELDHAGYEAAARCLADDLDALVVHLRYPLRHRKRWRSTNLLERSLSEVRRRTKVIGRFPGETSCLPARLGGARPVLQPRQQRRHLHRPRPTAPLPDQIPTRRRIDCPRGGDRRLDSPPGN
jgi:putative transposase